MNIEQQLNYVADRYRSLGFKVVLRPGPDDLPLFAKDFKVEMVATRDGSSALVSAKSSRTELEADPNVLRYVEITNQQPGWRFDVLVLGPDLQVKPEKQEVKELPEVEVRRHLDDIERMVRAGFVAPSLIAAWAALEAAMRRRLRADGEDAGWGTSPRTMLNQLYSSGAISTSVLRELEQLFHLRNAIAHGFSAPAVDANVVQFIVETARRLLEDSRPAKQTA